MKNTIKLAFLGLLVFCKASAMDLAQEDKERAQIFEEYNKKYPYSYAQNPDEIKNAIKDGMDINKKLYRKAYPDIELFKGTKLTSKIEQILEQVLYYSQLHHDIIAGYNFIDALENHRESLKLLIKNGGTLSNHTLEHALKRIKTLIANNSKLDALQEVADILKAYQSMKNSTSLDKLKVIAQNEFLPTNSVQSILYQLNIDAEDFGFIVGRKPKTDIAKALEEIYKLAKSNNNKAFVKKLLSYYDLLKVYSKKDYIPNEIVQEITSFLSPQEASEFVIKINN